MLTSPKKKEGWARNLWLCSIFTQAYIIFGLFPGVVLCVMRGYIFDLHLFGGFDSSIPPTAGLSVRVSAEK